MSRLRNFDRPTGVRIRRTIPTDHCGERIHVDVKKRARISAGSGHACSAPGLRLDFAHPRSPPPTGGYDGEARH